MDRTILPLSEVSKRLSHGGGKNSRRRQARGGRHSRRADPALATGEAIRGRLRSIGDFYKGYNPSGPKELEMGDINTYYMKLFGADIPFGAVVNAIYEEYETENGWMLQRYLWADKPNRNDFMIARGSLMRVYNKVWEERRNA